MYTGRWRERERERDPARLSWGILSATVEVAKGGKEGPRLLLSPPLHFSISPRSSKSEKSAVYIYGKKKK